MITGKEQMISYIKGWIGPLLQDVFRSTSGRYLDRKLHSFENIEIFNNEDMAEHFAHMYLEEIASQNVVKGFIIDRIQFFETILGKERISKETFIDIGDPDGIFIKALKKTGFSANISDIGVRKIYKKGIESIRCDAEHLPFIDNAIDNILFFEIFEHLPNPIAGLKELHRVAGKSVILSIPFVSKTTIHQYRYNPDWPIFEHHIFELDDDDFRKIISHAGFSVGHHTMAEVLKPATLKEHIAFFLWDLVYYIRKDPEYQIIHKDLYLGCFKKFSIYYLIKNT
jgi:SAM-dependent methyltransferase